MCVLVRVVRLPLTLSLFLLSTISTFDAFSLFCTQRSMPRFFTPLLHSNPPSPPPAIVETGTLAGLLFHFYRSAELVGQTDTHFSLPVSPFWREKSRNCYGNIISVSHLFHIFSCISSFSHSLPPETPSPRCPRPQEERKFCFMVPPSSH